MNWLISLVLAFVFHGALLTSHVATAQSKRVPGIENVSVLFGTDRSVAAKGQRVEFGSARAHTLSFGRASVSVQNNGKLAGITLRSSDVFTRDRFREAIKEVVRTSKQNKGKALVFIHGFNATFENALHRAGQLARNLPFDGPIILYSWPSGGGAITTYPYDRESSAQAEPYLRALLELVVEEVGAENVSIIAHGLGGQPLLRALENIGPALPKGTRLDQLLLVAPDVDRDVFEIIAGAIRPFVRGMTLYAAANDPGIQVVRRFAGGILRAGDVPPGGPLVLPGIDTIDATGANLQEYGLGHSSYGERGSVPQDMGALLKGVRSPPDQRMPVLVRVTTPAGDYWRFPGSGQSSDDGRYAAMPIFFGTDRKQDTSAKLVSFSAERGRKLVLGRALVTVPRAHQIAAGPERPSWLDIFSGGNPFREDPNKHFTLFEISILSQDRFVETARQRLAQSNVFRGDALVFVPGYNVTFQNALFRAAQFAYDLGFDGIPFVYSWPSGGSLKDYLYDRDSADLSVEYLLRFLELVIKESGATSVHLIAHSLGNEPLLKALQALSEDTRNHAAISQIILAAPDIDKDRFEKVATAITKVGRNRTLYVSANDAALVAARTAARDIARAGDVPAAGPIIIAGIDTIDASATSTGIFSLNHSGYAESRELLNDIKPLLQKGLRPKERTHIFEVVSLRDAFYWRFPK